MSSRFDRAASVEEIVFQMRLAEQTRAEDRKTILKLFNGNPPYDKATAEKNHIRVNRNDLEGVNILSQIRNQWNRAFLGPTNFFVAKPDVGPAHKRQEWSTIFTSNANKLLKRCRRMAGQIRATGANTVLYGIGPTMWKDRTTPVPGPIPVGSLLVPSETEIDDFENLSYFAVFREWSAAKLYEMTHGPRVDPGWNMDLVKSQIDYIRDELAKSPNSSAYVDMPERIEELIKQDKGYFGSDAVPTVDVWDFYFRDPEESDGWFRRVILDWGGGTDINAYGGSRPQSKNKVGKDTQFLYTSGKRRYADKLEEILHCQFADCSAYAPFKWHSVRGPGWMLWGVCDLQNRMHCKFNEAVFEQFMWFFATASNQDMIRLKKAIFEHMGVIPQGVRFLTPQERFQPNVNLIQMAFARNRQLMADSSTAYTQDYAKTQGQGERTATETMAIVNSAQALTSGILELAYTYEAFKDREILRRMCLKGNPHPMARAFRLACLNDKLPAHMLDVDKWDVQCERVVGGGNKTIQMATVGFLNSIRPNLPPNGQRIVDHLAVEAATDLPQLAEEIAPMGEAQSISNSVLNAQLATDRLLRGLQFVAPKDAVFEDYVTTWLGDLGRVIELKMQSGGLPTPDELNGMMNLANYIGQFIQIIARNPADKEKVRQYGDALGQLGNHLKGLAQRLQEQMAAQAPSQGGNGAEQAAKLMETQGKVEAMRITAEAKAANTRESHAQRTQQRQIAWELEQQRKNQELQADLNRDGIVTQHELAQERIKTLAGATAPKPPEERG